ncbi:hypothetical protein ACFXTN_025481 [Malus domestica]
MRRAPRKKEGVKQLLSLGYYWSTMRKDKYNIVKRCHAYQVHRNLIHKPLTLLQDMRTPWSFHTWRLDLIGTINSTSEGHLWILIATESFTKWVEQSLSGKQQE